MFSAHVPTAGPARPRPQRRVAGLLVELVLVSGSVRLIAAGAFAVLASAGTTYVGSARMARTRATGTPWRRRDGLAGAGWRVGRERPSRDRLTRPPADLRRRRPPPRDR